MEAKLDALAKELTEQILLETEYGVRIKGWEACTSKPKQDKQPASPGGGSAPHTK
tara:strand:+ start:689 stop:853 length:165 start_codon:yes stop_codon:yes gene_type:complete